MAAPVGVVLAASFCWPKAPLPLPLGVYDPLPRGVEYGEEFWIFCALSAGPNGATVEPEDLISQTCDELHLIHLTFQLRICPSVQLRVVKRDIGIVRAELGLPRHTSKATSATTTTSTTTTSASNTSPRATSPAGRRGSGRV